MGLIDYDLYCMGCRYNLRTQLEEGRCPECGGEVGESVKFAERLVGPFMGKFMWGLRLSLVGDGVCAVVLAMTGIMYAQLGFRVMFEWPWVVVPVSATVVLMVVQFVGLVGTWLMTGERKMGTAMGNWMEVDGADLVAFKNTLRWLAVLSALMGTVMGVLAIVLYVGDLEPRKMLLLVGGLSFLQLLGDGLELLSAVVWVRYLVRVAKDFRVEWLVVPTVVVMVLGVVAMGAGSIATLDNLMYATGGGTLFRRKYFDLLYWINRVGEVLACGGGVFLWRHWLGALRGLRPVEGERGGGGGVGEGESGEGI